MLLWAMIPKAAQARILTNVYCAKCGESVQIANFIGEEKQGDVILNGFCAKCGHEVVRVVETSETDHSRN